MRTPRKVFADIREKAKDNADSIELQINEKIEFDLRQKYIDQHKIAGLNCTVRKDELDEYAAQNFKPIEMSAEDRENIAKHYRTESYLDIVRRTIAPVLISVPLIFSAGSCVSCFDSPEYSAFNRKETEQNLLQRHIANLGTVLRDAEIDSLDSAPYRASTEELRDMRTIMERFTTYRDGIKNSSEYARIKEASDAVENKGLLGFLGGLVGAISMAFLSGYLGRVTGERRYRKIESIRGKYLPKETQ